MLLWCLTLVVLATEQPIYANTKATNKQAQNNTLKPCNQNLRNQKLGKRYDEGKRRSWTLQVEQLGRSKRIRKAKNSVSLPVFRVDPDRSDVATADMIPSSTPHL
ncbi:hypothetical protein fugu_005660 [Takifugu bimaculatus]|uniref:Secreted protein n=1 Tax=Takifugu bimaculatus TaxID=433685 RepID=A0A4Z2B6M4_9TELE|nr:hypothetical protein fugu_005660 [Takifugu bimaculatus]